MNLTSDELESIVHKLWGLPAETEWVEFKINLRERDTIGEYISPTRKLGRLGR